MFRWKRLRFLWSLSRKERKRWCLKHYRERDYHDECPECKDTTRAERNRINREMAYYNLALRDRELADNLLETGGLPDMVEDPLNRLPNAVQPGDFMPDVFEDFVEQAPTLAETGVGVALERGVDGVVAERPLTVAEVRELTR